MSDKIHVFDTTLRDGEQSAGVSFTAREKLEIARQLARLGVDVIEAGFPCATPGDLEAVRTIAAEVREATICALARAVAADIDTAWEAVRGAADARLHVFINSSDIQMAHQLRRGREEVLEQAEAMVRHAARCTANVEFSPMDATRSDRDFLYRMIERTVAAGATVVNIPDSVGYALPEEIAELFADIRAHVPNLHRARLSFHGHDDLGMSTANTLAAITGGARQVEVTLNGIGERAGNAALEEVVMAIATRRDRLGVRSEIDTRELARTSKLVERCTGMPVQWNKAIVGKNAFRHGSGIHQDGILKLRETWEIMDPASIGLTRGTELVLGKLSGRHAFRARAERLGYRLADAELARAFAAFKTLADRKVLIDDRDLEALLLDHARDTAAAAWSLDLVQVSGGTHATATATLRLRAPDGRALEDAATGSGPVDAVYRAMNRIIGSIPTLSEFSARSVTEGIDAQGEVTLRIESEGRTYSGRAVDTDIVVASARAYVDALNRSLAARVVRHESPVAEDSSGAAAGGAS